MKRTKESILRKQLINRVLDYNKVELLNIFFKLGLGTYISEEVDWDVRDGRSIITKFLMEDK